jgi:hypothetical protein
LNPDSEASTVRGLPQGYGSTLMPLVFWMLG